MNLHPMLALLPLAVVSLAGCGDGGATTGDPQNATAAKATIVFDADFGETVKGDLVDGERVVLVYDDARVEKCKAVQGGIPQYAVTAHFRIDGGEIDQIVVAGLQAPEKPTIELEGSGDLEVWFEVTGRHGCHAWDSNFGDNYVFEVGARGEDAEE